MQKISFGLIIESARLVTASRLSEPPFRDKEPQVTWYACPQIGLRSISFMSTSDRAIRLPRGHVHAPIVGFSRRA